MLQEVIEETWGKHEAGEKWDGGKFPAGEVTAICEVWKPMLRAGIKRLEWIFWSCHFHPEF